ncbi:MAG TPA: sigma 54-interacting transcriptional regulator [Edaphobacter sp.]|nr:sigma 54-interacting transcriptional regulator [Edaphobacter sp.]
MARSTFLHSPFQPSIPAAICGSSFISGMPAELIEEALIGSSDAMTRLRLQIRRIGPHFRSVLIHGASGVGKRTAAYTLHRTSPVANGPFLTSTSGERIGYLMKLAQRGTLYCEHIDRMSLAAQDEMLTMLARGRWISDGLGAPMQACPRVIASTTQDLRTLAAAGRFRQELYNYISNVQLSVPSLSDRTEDIPLLVRYFLDGISNGQEITLFADAMAWLISYPWPGNLRELKHLIESAVFKSEGKSIDAESLAALTKAHMTPEATEQPACEPARLQDVIEKHVLYVLKNCAGNKLRAAELLGISRSTLYRMLDSCSAAAVR